MKQKSKTMEVQEGYVIGRDGERITLEKGDIIQFISHIPDLSNYSREEFIAEATFGTNQMEDFDEDEAPYHFQEIMFFGDRFGGRALISETILSEEEFKVSQEDREAFDWNSKIFRVRDCETNRILVEF